jgi:N-acetylglucosamine malate deacetylase 1
LFGALGANHAKDVGIVKLMVIAPHPDDEVLGAGGTIAKMARSGWRVVVVISSKGSLPLFAPAGVEQVRAEARRAHELLGVARTIFLDEFPAALLDTVPHAELNKALSGCIREEEPDVLFVPFLGDLHLDHQKVFHSSMVAARPTGAHAPKRIYAYETLSETNWNAPLLTPGFMPNAFFDISETLDVKLEAMKIFESQLKPFPNERSIETLTALATLRGSTVGLAAAEAFILLREVQR